MTYQHLIYEKKDGIVWITVNRPQVLNALNPETMEEFDKAISSVEQDKEAKGLIITGAGDRSFIAGADIRELQKQDAIKGKEFAMKGQNILTRMENLRIPVVAAINGFALGGGLEVALACHIRIASENAKLGLPEVTLGIIPGYGGTQRLARIVGKGRALELACSGKMIDAQEAYRIGLVNQVTKLEELYDAAVKMVQSIAKNGPIAIGYVIEAINHGLNLSLEEGLRLEATLFGLTCATEDMREGTAAFLEKRKPEFKGR